MKLKCIKNTCLSLSDSHEMNYSEHFIINNVYRIQIINRSTFGDQIVYLVQSEIKELALPVKLINQMFISLREDNLEKLGI